MSLTPQLTQVPAQLDLTWKFGDPVDMGARIVNSPDWVGTYIVVSDNSKIVDHLVITIAEIEGSTDVSMSVVMQPEFSVEVAAGIFEWSMHLSGGATIFQGHVFVVE